MLPASVAVEIVGATNHTKVINYADKAKTRTAPVDDVPNDLLDWVQNVFDFDNQDTEEVNDSLSSAILIGTDITFGHKGIAVRFTERSRAYQDMRDVLGGNPYWLFVQIILGHNEYLLSKLNTELEPYGRSHHLKQVIEDLLEHSYLNSKTNEIDRLYGRFNGRVRLTHYIPNIFRYPTEQAQFELLSKARALPGQRDHFANLEATIERTLGSAVQEQAARADRLSDRTIQLLLLESVCCRWAARLRRWVVFGPRWAYGTACSI